MPKFKPQYRRLLFIDREIRKGSYPNCRSLAETWEVSSKTVQRDIDYLRYELNAPIDYDPGRFGFFYTEPNYRLPAISISESDLFAVCVAEQALRAFRNTPLHARLLSVFNKIEDSLPDRVSVHPAWLDSRVTVFAEPITSIRPDVWETIAVAMRENRQMALRYAGVGRDPSERTVDPYHLVSHRGEWYVIAYCHRSEGIRTFAVSRALNATLETTTFELPEQYDEQALAREQFGIRWDAKERAVAIRFDAKAAPYIRERTWHPEQTLHDTAGNGVEIRFRTRHLQEVRDWILSWGSHARPVKPKALVSMVRDELTTALTQYTDH
ncbi:MAG: WYL domain-containing protein [Kiritimatiellia bacterium]|nr:WYL domain-containing protein [Kiritimatiellia bacterium]MDP6809949.1 WYL domain-containing protein [Kiritimatiellia bacterium]MDP7025039.1 WYL domain-containing protein [Kiritimatiellia bacterium]